MRRVLVGVMVAVVAVAGPAFGGMDGAPCHPAQAGDHVHYGNPSGQVIVEEGHGAGAEFGLAVASTSLSLLYTPFRFVYGVVGAAFGGFGGWATGGDIRTAKGIWRPTTEGHYYIRPDYFDGTERFRFSGAVAPYEETARYEESVAVRDATPQSLDAAPYSDAAIDDAL